MDKEKRKTEDFLKQWDENASPEEFARDSKADDDMTMLDRENNLEFRNTLPLGYPFFHPMHDASLDVYEPNLKKEEEN